MEVNIYKLYVLKELISIQNILGIPILNNNQINNLIKNGQRACINISPKNIQMTYGHS